MKKSPTKNKCKSKEKPKAENEEYEIACEAADAEETGEESSADDVQAKIGIMTEIDKKFMIRVNGMEETPCVPTVDPEEKSKKSVLFLKKISSVKKSAKKPKCRLSMFNSKSKGSETTNNVNNNELKTDKTDDGNNNKDDDKVDGQVKYSTLPMVNKQKHKRTIAIPQRTTSDGTQIYYICDLPKKLKKGF